VASAIRILRRFIAELEGFEMSDFLTGFLEGLLIVGFVLIVIALVLGSVRAGR